MHCETNNPRVGPRKKRCTRRSEVPRSYRVCRCLYHKVTSKLLSNDTFEPLWYKQTLWRADGGTRTLLSYDRAGANRDRFIFSHEAHEYERSTQFSPPLSIDQLDGCMIISVCARVENAGQIGADILTSLLRIAVCCAVADAWHEDFVDARCRKLVYHRRQPHCWQKLADHHGHAKPKKQKLRHGKGETTR